LDTGLRGQPESRPGRRCARIVERYLTGGQRRPHAAG
jgi:hypothetical protein